MASLKILDNIVWNALIGPQAHFAIGTDRARRYAHGFSPIVGFENQHCPAFEDLAGFCVAGERFYTDGWSGAAPAGWQIEFETTMFKMVWDNDLTLADTECEAIRLGSEHAAIALELAELTHPGPFGPRTIELGEYYGFLDRNRLIAMAGERFHAAGFREISGVCTHPDYQRQGLAKRLMLKLASIQLDRGETPFLHVVSTNTGARQLYQRLGFREYKESVVRVVSRNSEI